MEQDKRIRLAISQIVTELMERVMDKVLFQDPFIKEDHHAKKPLYAALVPDEIFKGSHFERRFVTPFGKVWEQLANVVATEYHGHCEMGHAIYGEIGTERLRRIQEVLNRLEYRKKGMEKINPNWESELAYILEGKGKPIPTSVVCDVYIENQATGERLTFELKGPLPNSDQTKVSKEKMFKLLAMSPCKVDFAYYALPYNPYGQKKDYNWGFPMRWFNMHNDQSVLIGNEFWDLIGGKGTYKNFITEINNLGLNYRERIYKEFLCIDPPEGYKDVKLQ